MVNRPDGVPEESDFKLVEIELPEPVKGQVLVRTAYLSVDPYMRGLLREEGTYQRAVELGERMVGGTVGKVQKSRHSDFAEGDVVTGYWGWQEWAIVEGEQLEKFVEDAPISTALGVLGMPGMTAYFGLLDIGQPKAGETVFVSGAAGAVGSLVGQIAKIKGCQVYGSAGSTEKVEYLTEELGFDGALNYKHVEDYSTELAALCPNGVDVYFDNVGGKLSDAVFFHLNKRARVVICGQIDQYNKKTMARGPRLLWQLIRHEARAEGFLVFQFKSRYPEGRKEIARWLKEGRVSYRETIAEGLEQAPAGFIGLFSGDNTGKQLVRVS
ncbi:NADP-dependent oxidoreductase [bacterium]|nr:NADP-dependent oxidoreductase [bacterium]